MDVSAPRSVNDPEHGAQGSTRSLTPVTSAVQLHEFFSARGDEHGQMMEPTGNEMGDEVYGVLENDGESRGYGNGSST